jgi:hypothetical protein
MRPSAAAQLGLSLGKRFVARALASRHGVPESKAIADEMHPFRAFRD